MTPDHKLRFRRSVPQPLYVLWLPAETMTEPDGMTPLMDSPAVDGEREDGSGGLIDLLTSTLQVRWSSDDLEFDRALSWYRENIWGDA